MTDLLYLPDNDKKTSFEANVKKSEDNYFVLDRTAFYKEGGGQPSDKGKVTWNGTAARVTEVKKEHGEIRHYTEEETPEKGEKVSGHVDEDRRNKHMRMHTAQHVISLVVLREYDASTSGNQIHEDESRIDFKPADFNSEDLENIQRKANNLIKQDLEVEKQFMDREKLEQKVEEGRTNLDLIPSSVDPLRAVKFGDDICPCGGTHVDSLSEIGGIVIDERETKGENVERIRFHLEEN